ncbi:MAG: dUTP diphosphatase [Rothia sp. (in: high G+C Gram-positive bacteria)]|uniref:dUTP diphosphatase n=1 Tax=Rothia sp. (in: high G+C Gram-positive bacteria) TaxID=1885016 RepID=UPI0026E0CB57|nr:dUTP diphosphatase [Rothia sp. (in: high G+C Gram-positive bacteria)]MDO5750816.1 dUTP diphosphatase [Rothia sp. (in: high G+C Gram-positive bacteria)]
MTNPINVTVKLLDPELPAPEYAKPGDAGADLRSRVDVKLEPGERMLIPTGVAIALPEGFVGLVHPRSGLAVKHGITIVNAPGTIDSGYRGEIMITLLNTDRSKAFQIKRGDRIAQLVIQRYEQANFIAVEELDATERGTSGFGSSGLK